MSSFEPFRHSIGSRNARIVLVGEAFGASEETWSRPFVGAAGIELAQMLARAEVTEAFEHPRASGNDWSMHMIGHWERSGLFLTNVFADRPPSNNLDFWCGKKAEVGEGYALPPLKNPGKYIKPEYLGHLDRLYAEIAEVAPNLVIALGNTACWALLHQTNISKIRGTTIWSPIVNRKILPTFHPSAVLQSGQFALWPVVVMDLIKAKREAESPEIRRKQRWVIVNPTLADVREWVEREATLYAVDIETANRQISMIGFARSPQDAIVIPFHTPEGGHYWPTALEEREAWLLVKRLCESSVPKIFQNGLYDLSYIAKMGIRPRNCREDTMLLHHSIYPELRKGLDFLGSLYASESAWKLLRHSKTNKREE